jgi:cholinesterase
MLSLDGPETGGNVSLSAGISTWRYRYFGDFPDLRLTTEPDSGVYHSFELAVLFNTLRPAGNGIPPPTDAEMAIGKYMRGAWAAFAKDPANGLNSYRGGWPEYKPGKETLIRLAYNSQTGTNVALQSLYDASCDSTFPVASSG